MRAALSPPSFDNRNPDYCTPPFCPTCPIYNYSLQGEMPGTPIRGTVQHVSGSHSLSGLWTNACTYTNGPYLGNGYYACIANLSETSTGLALEGGTLQHLYTHSVATELTVAGGSLATYPQVAQATTSEGGAVNSCFLIPGCVQINISYNGVGFSYNPSTTFWTPTTNQQGSCIAYESQIPQS
jgi:hypothetical protein